MTTKASLETLHTRRMIKRHGRKSQHVAMSLDAMFNRQVATLNRHYLKTGKRVSSAVINRAVMKAMTKSIRHRFGKNGLTDDLLHYLRLRHTV